MLSKGQNVLKTVNKTKGYHWVNTYIKKMLVQIIIIVLNLSSGAVYYSDFIRKRILFPTQSFLEVSKNVEKNSYGYLDLCHQFVFPYRDMFTFLIYLMIMKCEN